MKDSTKVTKTRTKRTAAERAVSDYEVADRKVARTTKKLADAKAEVTALEEQLALETTQRNAYKNLADALGATGTTAPDPVIEVNA